MDLIATPSVEETRTQAVERRTFWETELQRARAIADPDHIGTCIQFISDYDALISDLDSLALTPAHR